MALPVAPIPGAPPPMGPQGPVAQPSPNAGKQAAALGKVRQAVTMLQQVVPDVDPASPMGKAVIKAIGDLSKIAPANEANPQAGVQGLREQLMQAMQGGPAAALQRSMASVAQPPGPTPIGAQ